SDWSSDVCSSDLLASTAPGMSRIALVPTGICRPVTALLAALVRTVFTRARLGAWNADNRRTRRGHWPASIFGRSIFGREERDMAQEALARLIAFGRTREGRADVTALLAKVMTPEARGKHLVGNVIARLVDGQHASAASDFAFIGRDGSLQTGRYIDDFVAADDRWLIAQHEIVFSPGPS